MNIARVMTWASFFKGVFIGAAIVTIACALM